MIKTSTAVEFYKTHFNEPLFIQEFEQEEFEVFEKKNYSDNNMFVNPKSANNPFENSDSDPQSILEIIEVPDSGESESASNSIRIEEKEADLLTSVGSDLLTSKGDDLQTPRGNNLQAGELPNLVGAPQNRVDEGASQATLDSAKERIPKTRRHKTVAPTATFEKLRRKRRAYDSKTFDKKKTPIALAAKSVKTSDRIVKLKIYHKTITGSDKKK